MKRRTFVSSAMAMAVGSMLDLRKMDAAGGTQGNSDPSTSTADRMGDLSELWKTKPNAFRNALLRGPGFSFEYDGHPAGPAEAISQRELNDGVETTFHYSADLDVIRTVINRPASDAIEYTLRLRNRGKGRSAAIQNLNALSASFGAQVLNGVSVISSGGGINDGVYPSDAFRIKRQWFNPTLPSRGIIALTTEGGRSSNRDLPFYFVHNDDEQAGIFVGIGWTGQWTGTIAADYGKVLSAIPQLQLRAGIPDIAIELDPGEEITGPRILIGSYEGSLADGSNKLRHLLREEYTPKLGGTEFHVISTYDSWYGIRERYDEALLRPLVDAAADIGQEYFLLDAAWYAGGSGPGGFTQGDGNWEEVDAAKFPSGLGEFATYVRSRNLKFGLWFEPERVHRDSLLGKAHPEWTIWLDGSDHGLLDYGRDEVRVWVREMMSNYITKLDIKYIRHDFNLDPVVYWSAADKKNRQGISQIRYIEGLYSVIDWVRERHPDTVLEGCASGGRRIDLETARRFHTYWISDDTVDPANARSHLQGVNYFLPGNYNYVQYTLPAPAQKDFVPRDIDYLSFFGGAFGTGGRIDLWPAEEKERFKKFMEIYKPIRSNLMNDYYPLLPQSSDLESWDAWQFHDPQRNTGFVEAFRGKTKTSNLRIPLCGLRADVIYEFHDPLREAKVRMLGGAAMREGMLFDIPPMSAAILIYKAAGQI